MILTGAALLLVILVIVGILGYRLLTLELAPRQPTATGDSKPSVVVILTDDQRWDTLWAMPAVKKDLIDHGVNFKNGFVVNSACCPSRASILTGQYSHSTGVYTNTGSEGGYRSFNDASTIPTWLEMDYTSVLIGKYLNNYEFAGLNGRIPLGWDHWVAFPRGHYENYALNIDGEVVEFGTGAENYSTDVLADQAVKFIEGTDGPLFMYFSPKAPHYPADPAPRDRHAFSGLAPWRPPNYNEADVSDKPQWVQATDPLTPAEQHQIDGFRLDQLRTLLAVDRAVSRIVDALQQTGRLSNTLIIYMSDNGMVWGEHRMHGKGVAYEESVRVPLVVRYDPLVKKPRTSEDLVANIDVAPTAADLAGVDAPGAEGMSLVPLLQNPNAPWRDDFLVEHFSRARWGHPPTYCAIRSTDYMYVDYLVGEDELYDVRQDPYELNNRISDPALSDELNRLKQRESVLCNPAPPKKLAWFATH